MIKRFLLLAFLSVGMAFIVVPTFSYAIGLDDDEEDAEDVADLLEQAKKAGKSESFSEADTLLKKAKMYGVSTDDTQEASKYVSQKKQARDERLERERQAKLKREREERERQARLERQRQQASDARTNYGLAKNQCYRASGNYALYNYCKTGSCQGFNSNYALHQLCKYDNPNGFHSSSRDTNIYLYLRNGGYLNYDYFSNKAAYQSGKFNGSFRERKNYILYLLNGMTLIRY